MTKILNRMNLMKNKKNTPKRKKHHHKPHAEQRVAMGEPNMRPPNISLEASEARTSCSAFLNPASRPQTSRQNAPFVLANSGASGGAKPKVSTAQKQRTNRKSSTTSKASPPTGNRS